MAVLKPGTFGGGNGHTNIPRRTLRVACACLPLRLVKDKIRYLTDHDKALVHEVVKRSSSLREQELKLQPPDHEKLSREIGVFRLADGNNQPCTKPRLQHELRIRQAQVLRAVLRVET